MSDCIVVEEYATVSDAFSATRGTVVADTARASDSVQTTRGTVVSDTMGASDHAYIVRVLRAEDSLIASDSVSSTSHRTTLVHEAARVGDAVRPGRTLVVSDGMLASDSASSGRRTQVHDTAVVSDSVACTSHRTTSVHDSMRAGDAVVPGRILSVVDSAVASDAVGSFVRGTTITDSATVADQVTCTSHRVTVWRDNLTIGDSVTPQAHHVTIVQDSIIASDSVSAPGQLAAGAAWTTALDALNAARWTAQPVVAAAVVDGHPVVATPQGLYELTGTTDAGADIAPLLRLPISDLGSRALTRIDHVYAVTQGGPFVLAVTPMDQDQPTYEYQASERTESGYVPTRVKVGRGLRSLMWQLEFRGIPGEPFALRSADITLIDTSRRV